MKQFISTLLFLFTAFSFQLQAQATATLSIQGVIKNSDGTAVENGNYSLTFRLYTTETGNTPPPVWTETQLSVPVNGGIYSALLGEEEDLTAPFDQTYYLGVSVDGGTELMPRAQLTSSPYALSLIGVGNTFPSSGTIGAGTATPDTDYQLHTQNDSGEGKVLVEGSDGATITLKKGGDSAQIDFDGTTIHVGTMTIDNLTLPSLTTTTATIDTLNLDAMNTDITLVEGKSIIYDELKDWRLIDRDDFENTNDYEGWNAYINVTSSTTMAKEIVQFGNAYSTGNWLWPYNSNDGVLKKQMDLTGILHNYVKVIFTFWWVETADTQENDNTDWAYAGFANSLTSKPDNGWSHDAPPRLPDQMNDLAAGAAVERGTRVEMVISHDDDNIVLVVGGFLNEGYLNERYALANVEIWVR